MDEVLENTTADASEQAKGDRVPRVAVAGACTPFGREVFRSLSQWDEVHFCVAIDSQEIGKSMRELAGGRSHNVCIEDKLGVALDREGCDILLDFSHSTAGLQHAISAMKRGVRPILGGAHLSNPDLRELTLVSQETNLPAFVIPYFSFGGVLLMRLCNEAAKWMSDVELVDVQADHKTTQLSVPARAFAEQIAEGWEHHMIRPHGYVENEMTKTWQDVSVHPVRIKGSTNHQHIVVGSSGETISVRYDWHDTSSIVEGVRLAIRKIQTATGVTVGLDKLMFGKNK